MNTAPKSKLAILARFLGPVLSLDGELTKNDQNLIFARNGTGKSFLSRAFRYLDLHGQKRDISDAAFNLVSDESVDGKGSFSFSRGLNQMGTLNLEKSAGLAAASMVNTIFHVFSEDFVHEELRDRKYELDGQIENQITVDSENIKLDDAHNSLDKARGAAQEAYRAASGKFEVEKISELHKKAEINRQLKEYKDLGFDSVLERYAEKPAKPEQSFANILKDLDSLKAIPAEPLYPDDAIAVPSDDIDLKALAASLERITSPSSVSVEIKKKIDAHHGFFEEGTRIVRQEHRTLCPFCEQAIVDPNPKAIIDAYIAYFEDEEEKHKAVLRVFFRELQQKQTQLDQTEKHLLRQKSRYDDLKRYIPSKKEVVLDDGQSELKSISESLCVPFAASASF